LISERGLRFSVGQLLWVKNRSMLFPGRVAQIDFSLGRDFRPYLVQYLACSSPCGAHVYGWHGASGLLAWSDGKEQGAFQPRSSSKLLMRALTEARRLEDSDVSERSDK
ncbi:unnamed protein product, partial [Cladocopium goreaui]